jgi:hypothetical protein
MYATTYGGAHNTKRVFGCAVEELILVKNNSESKVICVWIHSFKSELNYKFVCENQFLIQKLQILVSSIIN